MRTIANPSQNIHVAPNLKKPSAASGLLTLNLDILRLITEELNKTGTISNFQLACKFLRGLVLETPSVWTKVTTRCNPVHYLTRSKNCPLTIYIDVDSGEWEDGERSWQLQTFVELVAVHASRWETLCISFSSDHDLLEEDLDLLDALRSPSFPTYFPKLQHLVVKSDPCASGDTMTHFATPTATLFDLDFIGQWETPALWMASFQNSIPTRMKAPCSALLLHWNDETGDDGAESLIMANYTSLLQPLNHLRVLKLRVGCLVKLICRGPPVVLPQLECLSLDVTIVYRSFLEGLLDNLRTPNVRFLEFKEEDPYHDYNTTFNQEILFPDDQIRWPYLETIRVLFSRFDCSPDNGEPPLGRRHPLHCMLTRLPNITSLYIAHDYGGKTVGNYDIPSVNLAVHPLISGFENPSFPPLHDLTLEECRLGTEFFSDNLCILTAPMFKRLHLKGTCDLMDIDAIRDMLPPDKIMMRDGEIIPF